MSKSYLDKTHFNFLRMKNVFKILDERILNIFIFEETKCILLFFTTN